EKIIEKNKDKKYDYILIIKCEMITEDILIRLKEHYSDAVFCLYLYDSIKNIKGIVPKMQLFDRVMSFDLADVNQYKNIMFRPLFYLDIYKREYNANSNYLYDLSFIGTVHSDRFSIIKNVKET